MRSLIYAYLVLAIVTATACSYPTAEPITHISIQIFYEELRPHGTWVAHSNHGAVWLPMEDSETFFPYGSQGYWIYTDLGWTWISVYTWGWITFHYGRWDYEQPYGWFWVPDTVWGPAWVNWRHSPGYFGWSPMRPGITATSSKNCVPDSWWLFCDHLHFGYRTTTGNYVPRAMTAKIIDRSKVVSQTCVDKDRNVIYIVGPDRSSVERQTGRKLEMLVIEDLKKPGQKVINGTVALYRPFLKGKIASGQTPSIEEVRAICPLPSEPVLPNELVMPTDNRCAKPERPIYP